MAIAKSKQPKDNGEPFPAKQLLALGLCRLAEPIAFISIVSYNFAMVTDIKGPENASFYAGVLVSAFAIAEATTAIIWGSLSDRIGRKPVIMIGLTGTAISSLMLGFAKKYWVALAARLIGGLLNGNVAVMQTMVAEIVRNPKHEPRAYSIQPFAWSLGSIAGSALGGYAAQPARFYPEYFSPDGLFGKYPYLLPNLVAAVCIVMAIIQAAFFLQETNPLARGYKAPEENSNGHVDELADETTPLRWANGTNSGTNEHYPDRKRRPSYSTGSIPTPTEPAFDVRRSSFASIRSFKAMASIASSESAVDEEDDTQSEISGTSSDAMSTGPVMWIVAIALMCYHQMAFISAFPIYMLDVPRRLDGLDLKGGLGLNVHDVGRYMSVNSVWALFVQLLILPNFMAKVGLWRSVIILTLATPIVDIIFPFITALNQPKLAVYFIFAFHAFCTNIIYPSLLIMLKNATPSRALGRVNGMAVSASSAARTIAPPLVGIIYSAFGSAGAWWSCAGFATFAIIELCFIPQPKQDDKTIIRRASVQIDSEV